MHEDLLSVLRCPACQGSFQLAVTLRDGERVLQGRLSCASCGAGHEVEGGIPRFVSRRDGGGSFGLQWTSFPRTQLDSVSGHPISRERFLRYTGWEPEALRGRLVLDVGCGAGRFAEIALSLGARVVAVDYTVAVDACLANLGEQAGLNVVQADVYHLPLAPAAFDFVYCLGVLQHTPDVKAAFFALPRLVKSGGGVAVDVYPKQWLNWIWPKYWLRPLTRRLPPATLYRIVSALFPVLYPVSRALGRVPRLGRRLRYLVPVANYDGVLPLSPAQLREWGRLDTFDMLSPRYDRPQTPETLRAWFEEAGLTDVRVERPGFVVGRGVRPPEPSRVSGECA